MKSSHSSQFVCLGQGLGLGKGLVVLALVLVGLGILLLVAALLGVRFFLVCQSLEYVFDASFVPGTGNTSGPSGLVSIEQIMPMPLFRSLPGRGVTEEEERDSIAGKPELSTETSLMFLFKALGSLASFAGS